MGVHKREREREREGGRDYGRRDVNINQAM